MDPLNFIFLLSGSLWLCNVVVIQPKQQNSYMVNEWNQKKMFLNQAHARFLKIDPVRIVGMRVCVCVSAPKAINN